MRVEIFMHTGYSNGIAAYLSNEGHSVTTMLYPYIEATTPPDIAIFDNDALYLVADKMRGVGAKVLGASQWASMIGSNDDYRKKIIEAVGYKFAGAEQGVRSIVACIFNGQRFIGKCLALNYTKWMAGDVGVDVESTGYLCHFGVEKSKLVEDTLAPLEKFLRKANHRGFFSVETVANEKGVFVETIYPSFSKPWTQAFYENTYRSKSDIMLDIFNESSQPIKYCEPYACGVMISVAPFPFNAPGMGIPITGISAANLKHLWLIDATNTGHAWECSGQGCLGYVIARGMTLEEVKRRVYRTVANLGCKDIQWRNDIGKDAGEKFHKLRDLKLI